MQGVDSGEEPGPLCQGPDRHQGLFGARDPHETSFHISGSTKLSSFPPPTPPRTRDRRPLCRLPHLPGDWRGHREPGCQPRRPCPPSSTPVWVDVPRPVSWGVSGQPRLAAHPTANTASHTLRKPACTSAPTSLWHPEPLRTQESGPIHHMWPWPSLLAERCAKGPSGSCWAHQGPAL